MVPSTETPGAKRGDRKGGLLSGAEKSPGQGDGTPVSRSRLARCLSTVLGVGFLPRAPGTFGTLAALPLLLALAEGPLFFRAAALSVLAGVAVWASGRYAEDAGRDDPPEVVLDEVVGYLAASLWLPVSGWCVGLSFFLFRFFDILKPFPIRSVERRLPGGWGIVADDIMAGAYTLAGAKLILFFSR